MAVFLVTGSPRLWDITRQYLWLKKGKALFFHQIVPGGSRWPTSHLYFLSAALGYALCQGSYWILWTVLSSRHLLLMWFWSGGGLELMAKKEFLRRLWCKKVILLKHGWWGNVGQAEGKIQAGNPPPLPPDGICVISLGHAWLPKTKERGLSACHGNVGNQGKRKIKFSYCLQPIDKSLKLAEWPPSRSSAASMMTLC